MKFFVYLFALLLPAGFLCAQSTSVEGMKADITCLRDSLPLKHYNFFSTFSKESFNKQLDALEASLAGKTNSQFAIALQRIIMQAGDSHTSLVMGRMFSKDDFLPMQCYWFNDGIFILRSTTANKEIIGKRLVAINRFPIEQITDSLKLLFVNENNAVVKTNIPKMLPVLPYLVHFNFAQTPAVMLTVEDNTGARSDYQLTPGALNKMNMADVPLENKPLYAEHRSDLFYATYLDADSIYYVIYNKCNSREVEEQYGRKDQAQNLPSFEAFKQDIFRVLGSLPVSKMVFDMRLNSGGSSPQGTQFVSELSNLPIAQQRGKLFVVIGRETFSSAILNTMDFKNATKAILIGEETGGKPNHFGEVRSFTLPNTGIGVRYSTKYFSPSKEDIQTITPDIVVEDTFTDYRLGVDPVLEYIKTYTGSGN